MLKSILDWLGYEVYRKKKNASINALLSNVIKRQNVDLVLDVGANNGQFVDQLRAAGYQGLVCSFEPVKATFEALASRAENDPNWQVYQLALGAHPGEITINVTQGPDFSSVLVPNAFGQEKFGKNLQLLRQEHVALETLSNFLVEKRVSRDTKIFLKMDTQGYDLEVFAGASDWFNNILYILTEISFQPIYQGMPLYHDVLKHMENHGFAVAGFYPISRNSDFSVIEMDCLLVKRQPFLKRRIVES